MPSRSHRGHLAGLLLTIALPCAAAGPAARGHCAAGADDMVGPRNTRIDAVAHGLVPAVVSDRSVPQEIGARMRHYEVPGVSVAVIHDGRIEWARGWGVRDRDSCAPVTPRTVFQAASISKSVAALAAMRLVQAGKLDLDQDINHALTSWTLPSDPALAPGFVTLRQLLSHTAGTTVHGFPGYARGEALPALTQILDGAPPANSPAVRMELPPGRQFRYSGGGYLVAQQAMTDVAKLPYATLVAREVFGPLHMDRSGVAPEPPASAHGDVASGHNGMRVVPGRFHRYPELAAAAVWTTPSDLARLLIGVQRAAAGAPSPILSQANARQMLARQTDGGDIAAGWGLGFALAGEGAERRFGHDGRNEGFESTMTAYVERGDGVVVLTNGDRGKALADEIVRAVANVYGFAGLGSRRVAEVAVPAETLARDAGFYSAGPIQVSIEHRDTHLYARIDGGSGEQLLALSPNRFITTYGGIVGEFQPGATPGAPAAGLRIIEGGPPVTLARTTLPTDTLGKVRAFVRGAMNGWSTADPLVPAADGALVAEIALPAGSFDFKIAAEDWAQADFGGTGDSAPIAGHVESLPLVAKGANLHLVIDAPGVYRFTVAAPGSDAPRLGVARVGDAAAR